MIPERKILYPERKPFFPERTITFPERREVTDDNLKMDKEEFLRTLPYVVIPPIPLAFLIVFPLDQPIVYPVLLVAGVVFMAWGIVIAMKKPLAKAIKNAV